MHYKKNDSLFSAEFYFWVSIVPFDASTLFVDFDILLVSATVVSNVDVNFLSVGKSSVFPTAATSDFEFSLYLCLGSFLGRSVVPVR